MKNIYISNLYFCKNKIKNPHKAQSQSETDQKKPSENLNIVISFTCISTRDLNLSEIKKKTSAENFFYRPRVIRVFSDAPENLRGKSEGIFLGRFWISDCNFWIERSRDVPAKSPWPRPRLMAIYRFRLGPTSIVRLINMFLIFVAVSCLLYCVGVCIVYDVP